MKENPPPDDPILEDRRLVLASMSRRDGEAWLTKMRAINQARRLHRADLMAQAAAHRQ